MIPVLVTNVCTKYVTCVHFRVVGTIVLPVNLQIKDRRQFVKPDWITNRCTQLEIISDNYPSTRFHQMYTRAKRIQARYCSPSDPRLHQYLHALVKHDKLGQLERRIDALKRIDADGDAGKEDDDEDAGDEQQKEKKKKKKHARIRDEGDIWKDAKLVQQDAQIKQLKSLLSRARMQK